jgi:hypothetical protein
MSDYERGPYTPPSDRLAFDRRQPERGGGGPAPVTLIVSALVLAAIVGGVFLVYRGGIRHKGAPTAVGAPLADIKSPAPPAESANAAPAALVIDKSDASANAAPAVAPPPEEPLPRPTPVAPQPVAAAPPARVVSATPVATPTPVVAAKPPPAAATTATPAAKPAAPLTIASIANAALEAGPPLKPKPKPAAAAVAPVPTMSAGAAPTAGWAQIGSFSSTALADKGWHDTEKFSPDALAGKGVQIQPASVNGKTFYRTFVTGFPSRAAAEAFCGKLKAANKPCIVK